MGISSPQNKDIPILVVDDFETMRRIVRYCLSDLGFTNIDEAQDGVQALEMAKSGHYRLIISDWRMPALSGVGLLRALRSSDRTKEIPFILITPEDKKELLEQETNCSRSNCLVKPFNSSSFAMQLQGLL